MQVWKVQTAAAAAVEEYAASPGAPISVSASGLSAAHCTSAAVAAVPAHSPERRLVAAVYKQHMRLETQVPFVQDLRHPLGNHCVQAKTYWLP